MNTIRELIRTEIHSTAAELRELKRWWRTPPAHREAPPPTRFALHPSKQRATLLCMIMAHSRWRIHQRSSTREEQGAQILERVEAMERMKLHKPLLDASLRNAARAILARCGQLEVPPIEACVAPTEERRA